MRSGLSIAAAAVLLAFGIGAARPEVTRVDATVNGLKVDRYGWLDSKGLRRTVSLKKQGEGNPGNGGYAVQMTYQVVGGAGRRTIIANAQAGFDGGFGYFVSHERYRNFTDGDNHTIARKIFRKSDSPLGLSFPVVGEQFALADPDAAAHRFTLTYPRYGTITPIPKDPNTGEDVQPTSTDPAESRLYNVGISIIWVFQDGTDYPRVRTLIDMSKVRRADRVNFDIRGPYGVLNFDDGGNRLIDRVMWGDRFHFTTLGKPLTRNSAWTWNRRNRGARYTALIAGDYEMGLLEPRKFTDSALVDGWSDEARGSTSAAYNGGNGCPFQDQLLPCDWEWPYQSAQYSLPYDNPDGATNFEKIAWGSAAYYGTGPSLPRVYDGPGRSRPFDGFPDSRRIVYSVCVVLGRTVPGGLTRSVAAGPTYNCATAGPA